jgi:hypothetical protein
MAASARGMTSVRLVRYDIYIKYVSCVSFPYSTLSPKALYSDHMFSIHHTTKIKDGKDMEGPQILTFRNGKSLQPGSAVHQKHFPPYLYL